MTEHSAPTTPDIGDAEAHHSRQMGADGRKMGGGGRQMGRDSRRMGAHRGESGRMAVFVLMAVMVAGVLAFGLTWL